MVLQTNLQSLLNRAKSGDYRCFSFSPVIASTSDVPRLR
ncbi:RHS repeat-associated core domain protein containing protein [Cystobacter fuscus DSM 2262]|uniref:RHS repeat-associated core domain protein containing protein n=1 Tax=Cystobacter fuscus (strain ATCC 25194 / DSM 2262 / NBRC 100088 / M29) TaxID=1242864 RepID=S9P4D9_CYSF2|nr:RHS repeat-associated core domain protein containing protein [Cystobacter fuscus DSM 2262]